MDIALSRQAATQVTIGIAHLEGCTISSVLTSLVTDFNSSSEGRTRESSFSPKLHHNKNKGLIAISPSPIPRAPTPNREPPTTHLWIRLFIDPSGALPHPIQARFICANKSGHQKTPRNPNAGEGRGSRLPVRAAEHLVRNEVDDGLGLLRGCALCGGDAAPEVLQGRRRREGTIAARGCDDRRGGARVEEAPGSALDWEHKDTGLHRALRHGGGGRGLARRGGGREGSEAAAARWWLRGG
jgi:hypothetical protein